MSTQHHPHHQPRTTDGRTLAVDELGRPEGRPVLFLHSAPGSRRLDPDPGATEAAGVRLLLVDRPGYGRSDPYPAGAVPAWSTVAHDLAAVLDALGLDRVAVVGWSQGGLGALALATLHPERVSVAVLAGTPAHDDDVPWVGEEFRGLLHHLRAEPQSAMTTLEPALAELAADPAAAIDGLLAGAVDAGLLEHDGRREALTAMLREAFRQGTHGLAADITATNVSDWGFDVADVRAPVHLFYGAADTLIPSEHAGHYLAHVPRASLRLLPATGHLIPTSHWRDILAAVEA